VVVVNEMVLGDVATRVTRSLWHWAQFGVKTGVVSSSQLSFRQLEWAVGRHVLT
jgi:hypothetical protein